MRKRDGIAIAVGWSIFLAIAYIVLQPSPEAFPQVALDNEIIGQPPIQQSIPPTVGPISDCSVYIAYFNNLYGGVLTTEQFNLLLQKCGTNNIYNQYNIQKKIVKHEDGDDNDNDVKVIIKHKYSGGNDNKENNKPTYTYDSYEEYNEIVEPICKKHGGKLDGGSGECIFDENKNPGPDIYEKDIAKATVFEKELDDRGLGHDYTAEEEASWNQQKEEEERTELIHSEDFKEYVESKGIDYDEDYHWLSEQEQKQVESNFKQEQEDSDEKQIVAVVEDWRNEVKEDTSEEFNDDDDGTQNSDGDASTGIEEEDPEAASHEDVEEEEEEEEHEEEEEEEEEEDDSEEEESNDDDDDGDEGGEEE